MLVVHFVSRESAAFQSLMDLFHNSKTEHCFFFWLRASE